MNVTHIHKLNLPQLDVYVRLIEAQHLKRIELEKCIFVIESLKVVRFALQCCMMLRSFLTERKNVDEQVIPLHFGTGFENVRRRCRGLLQLC